MMARFVTLTMAVFFIFSVAVGAEMFLGIVDLEKVIERESRFARAQKEIEQMIEQFDTDRERGEKDLEDLAQRLQNAQNDDRRDLFEQYRREMNEKSAEYQNFMAETYGPEGIIESYTDRLMTPLYEKLEAACKKVGQRRGIALIIDRENLDPLYAADSLDITMDVLTELKKLW